MNSKSKSFNDNCFENEKCEPKCHCEPRCHGEHCEPLHPLPTSSLLSCGQGSGVAIPLATATSPFFSPIPIASVTIDTTCLCNPTVKIDFNSIINYQALLAVGTLTTPFTVTFQLSKTCNDGSKIALGTWDYSQGALLALAVNSTNSFGFSYCECHACPGCCVYTVEIVRATGTIATATAGILTLTENASIRSSSISAMAASKN